MAPAPALADPPSKEDIRSAKKLARQASRLARKKKWGEAAPLYGQAEGLHPIWDYAYALAEGHAKNDSLVASWRALKRGESYGVPNRRRKKHAATFQKVESRLLQTHAMVTLSVVPEGATVKIAGQGWLPPWVDWVSRERSVLIVEHPECVPLKVTWRHPIGTRAQRTIRLTLKTSWGRLRVTGKPDGAKVTFAGKHMGLLPDATSTLTKPGRYPLKVEAPNYVPVTTTGDIDAGLTNEIKIILPEVEGDFARLMKSKRFWGWVSAGTGGALLITGIGLLGHAASLVSDAEALNAEHAGGYDAYSAQYDDITSPIPTEVTAGWVTFGLGLALGATGTALLLLDHFDDSGKDDASAGPRIRVIPGPTGASAVMRF